MEIALTLSIALGALLLRGPELPSPVSPVRFDEAKAMRNLYVPYEANQTTANSSVPVDHYANLSGSQFKPGDPLIVRPFWSGTYKDGGTRTTVLLTYAVPFDPSWKPIVPGDTPFSCHACTPLIGVAVFTWSGREWLREASQVAVTRGGAWGSPPAPIRLMKVGPHRMAVELDEDYEGGGVTTMSKDIIPFHDSTISRALHIETGENNAGECELHRPSNEPECYRYKKTVSFTSGPNADYYDIHAVLHGTDYKEGSSEGVHSVAGTEVFRFVSGEYVSIERHGAVTGTEKAIEVRK